MSGRSEHYPYTIGNIVVYANHVYIARTVAEEATTSCIPQGKNFGTIVFQGEPVRWHVIGAQHAPDQGKGGS